MHHPAASWSRWWHLLVPLLAMAQPAAAVGLLGSATNFAVLGTTTVTNIGATATYGDLGVTPGTAITGLGTITQVGGTHIGDAVAALASLDAAHAAAALSARPFDVDLSGQDLGALGPLAPGIYRFASAAQLSGTLTLDYTGNSRTPFIFQIGTTLTTASNASVEVIGGDAHSGLFWIVGSAATLGSGTRLAGNVIAATSITLNSGADILCGRAIALGGAVTLDSNRVSNDCSGAGDLGSGRVDFGSGGFAEVLPEPGSWALMIMGFGLTGTALRRARLAA
jgi:hypothetical protein